MSQNSSIYTVFLANMQKSKKYTQGKLHVLIKYLPTVKSTEVLIFTNSINSQECCNARIKSTR